MAVGWGVVFTHNGVVKEINSNKNSEPSPEDSVPAPDCCHKADEVVFKAGAARLTARLTKSTKNIQGKPATVGQVGGWLGIAPTRPAQASYLFSFLQMAIPNSKIALE